MIEVIPAIIAKSYGELEEKVKLVEPYIAKAQLDIMDGNFVDNETIKGFEELSKLDTNLKFDIHLMVKDPTEYVEEFLKIGKADKFSLHIESKCNFNNLINLIHEKERKIGFSLNPPTQNEVLAEYFNKIDFIQFMTVTPGFYGSPFEENVLDKMSDFHYMYPNIPIQVDGGINKDTAQKAVQAGASILISGSYIFNSDDIGEAINTLQRVGE